MTTPKVSIIVPIYNAADCIEACLTSLMQQSLQAIEIIAVLDCPSDNTPQKVKQLATLDPRIKVVENTHNLHIGESRNIGIKNASGEYIGFVDHDDIVHPLMYETLYALASTKQADIVFSPCKHLAQCGKSTVQVNSFTPPTAHTNLKEHCLHDLFGNGNNDRIESQYINILGCIYRREFVIKNNLKFVDTRHTTPEDFIFQLEAITHCRTIALCNQYLYSHIDNEHNEGHSKQYKDITKRLRGLHYIYQQLLTSEYTDNFYCMVQKSSFNFLLSTLIPFPNIVKFSCYRKQLRAMPYHQEAFAQLLFKHKQKGLRSVVRQLLYNTLR